MNFNFDWKHIVAVLLGGGLAIGLAALEKNGISVPCPAAPSAVISAPAK